MTALSRRRRRHALERGHGEELAAVAPALREVGCAEHEQHVTRVQARRRRAWRRRGLPARWIARTAAS